MGETLRFVTLSNGYEELNTLSPIPRLGTGRASRRAATAGHAGMVFRGALCWMLALGRRVRFGYDNPVPSNRQLARRIEGGKRKNASTPRIRSTRGNGHYLNTKAEDYNIDEVLDTIHHDGYIGVFGGGTRLAMPK